MKKKCCSNCRYRIWEERFNPMICKDWDICGGCYSSYPPLHWKRRFLWQMIRDAIVWKLFNYTGTFKGGILTKKTKNEQLKFHKQMKKKGKFKK